MSADKQESLAEEQQSYPRIVQPRSRWRRLMALGSIFFILLSAYYAVKDVFVVVAEMRAQVREQGTESQPQSFTGRFNALVKRQVGQLGKVDPLALGGTFTNSLNNTDCSWFVDCKPRQRPALHPLARGWAFEMPADVQPPPRLILRVGPIPIPTWHTIGGAPLALLVTCRAIAHAGYWAIAMFLSCAILWLVLFISAAKSDTPLIAWFLLIGAPLGISTGVYAVQHVCMWVLNVFGFFGCLLAVGITGFFHSAALALAVGFRHVAKTPHELVEQVEKLRSI